MRQILVVVALVLLVSATITGLASRFDVGLHGPIYSVSDITYGVQRYPTRWIGRTLLIRGDLTSTACGYYSCMHLDTGYFLVPSQKPPAVWLFVAPGATPLFQRLRGIPLISRFLSPEHTGVGVYRVRISAKAPTGPGTLMIEGVPPSCRVELLGMTQLAPKLIDTA